jgi:hypothetical protein
MSSLFIHIQALGIAMEITFGSDGWAAAAFVCTLLFVLAVIFFGILQDNKPLRAITMTLISFIVLYGTANGITALVSPGWNFLRPASSLQIAEHFGLQSGEKYPLLLGSRFAATSGSFDYTESLFYTQSSAQWSPSTGLSVGFQHQERSYILEFPTGTTTFVQKEGVEPTVTLYLKDEASAFGDLDSRPVDCDWQWHNFWIVCFKDDTASKLVISEETERQGLGPVVLGHFSSATITLTPEMYRTILTGEQ